jgi:hypothetical protein
VGAHPAALPRLNVALSEGGIGWVPMLLDRLDYVMEHSASGMSGVWDGDVTPTGSGAAQLLVLHHRRPDHPAGARPHRRRPHHGGERLPHADSSWPDTRPCCRPAGPASAADVAKLTHENASRLFRHPVPPEGFVPVAG